MSKSQFEIMGIAILIAIITFGGLIFFVITQSQNEGNIVKAYSNTEFAQGYIEALLKTTAENCKGYTVNELLKDCATKKAITCTDGKSQCDKAKEVANEALEKTLKSYSKEYGLKAVKTDGTTETKLFSDPQLQSQGYPCTEKERPGRQPLPPDILLTLEICG